MRILAVILSGMVASVAVAADVAKPSGDTIVDADARLEL